MVFALHRNLTTRNSVLHDILFLSPLKNSSQRVFYDRKYQIKSVISKELLTLKFSSCIIPKQKVKLSILNKATIEEEIQILKERILPLIFNLHITCSNFTYYEYSYNMFDLQNMQNINSLLIIFKEKSKIENLVIFVSNRSKVVGEKEIRKCVQVKEYSDLYLLVNCANSVRGKYLFLRTSLPRKFVPPCKIEWFPFKFHSTLYFNNTTQSQMRVINSIKLLNVRKRRKRTIESSLLKHKTESCTEIIVKNNLQGHWRSGTVHCLETNENLISGRPCVIFDLSDTRNIASLSIVTKDYPVPKVNVAIFNNFSSDINDSIICQQISEKSKSGLFNCGENTLGRYVVLFTDDPSLVLCEMTINNKMFEKPIPFSLEKDKKAKSFLESIGKAVDKILFSRETIHSKTNLKKENSIKAKYNTSIADYFSLDELTEDLLELGINRAMNRPSYQKDFTKTNPTDPNLANDGIVNTCTFTNYVEKSYNYPWWMVQLDDDTIVEKVVLISQRNEIAHMSAFLHAKWPINNNNNHVEKDDNTVLCFRVNLWKGVKYSKRCYNPIITQYLVVKTLRTQLMICEVQIFGKDVDTQNFNKYKLQTILRKTMIVNITTTSFPGKMYTSRNLAFGKKIFTGENVSYQSSDTGPQKAIDNLLFTCTNLEFLDYLFAWIAIDLQKKKTVAQIRIKNIDVISNQFSAFMTDIVKSLLDKKFSLNGDACYKERKSNTREIEGICITPVSGVYAVLLSHTPFLTICEVAVFQKVFQRYRRGTLSLNLLLGHDAFQSSTVDGQNAGLAIDGFLNTCSVTEYDISSSRKTGAWWFVDIGRIASIKRIELRSGNISHYFF
ncbi:DgyrCDS10378 [Dimorphilus gyrociliatus]|uniref:DgyrCDS10378 n=1 Tax=Dimorphilus gyrociliatus TaxID=2664684 RepID=A0A7I8W1E0_9ANNE|nr:DgyrCDS10378 [Dimorphilus gyrociliatus]